MLYQASKNRRNNQPHIAPVVVHHAFTEHTVPHLYTPVHTFPPGLSCCPPLSLPHLRLENSTDIPSPFHPYPHPSCLEFSASFSSLNCQLFSFGVRSHLIFHNQVDYFAHSSDHLHPCLLMSCYLWTDAYVSCVVHCRFICSLSCATQSQLVCARKMCFTDCILLFIHVTA